MNYEEFKQEVADRIKEFLPEKYADADVSIQTVVKNNDQKLDGLMVKLEDSNIAPNIYLNQFYEQHEDGRPMDDILAAIADVRTQHEMSQDFDVSKLTDFDSVKDRITCRLINAEQNAEYLADKPHTMVDDLAVTYHIAIGKEESGTMSAPITNRLMEGYGVDVEQLHQIALDNMDTLTPATFKSMTETMVDMMLPDMSGSEILKNVRSEKKNEDIQIIIISANHMIMDKVDGLDLGADDYIEKPFDLLELMSRVQARARRIKKKQSIYEINGILLNADKRICTIENNEIELTNKEFEILTLLMKNEGNVVTRDEIFMALWGTSIVESRTLDMHIKSLRAKLLNKQDMIKTVYGVGYKLTA